MFYSRLQVVSNFGDCDCGAAKYTRARESLRRRDAKGVCILPAPQSPSPILETTRSLVL